MKRLNTEDEEDVCFVVVNSMDCLVLHFSRTQLLDIKCLLFSLLGYKADVPGGVPVFFLVDMMRWDFCTATILYA